MKPWSISKRDRYDTHHLRLLNRSVHAASPIAASRQRAHQTFLIVFKPEELPAQDGADLHVRLLPGAGLPTHHHCLHAQRVQGAPVSLFAFVVSPNRRLPSLHLIFSPLVRLASSGRSELRCTPAPPAATTWARTTS